MRFAKGHGTGNDFVILPDVEDRLVLTPALVRALCDRRTGIGGDGLLRVVRFPGTDRWFLDYHNADGTVAEMCGNGVRVYARYLVASGLAPPGDLLLDTRAGPRAVVVPATGDVTVDMGVPALPGGAPRVAVGGRPLEGPATEVDMGNPHIVVRVDDPAAYDLSVAPVVTPTVPAGVNVELVALHGPDSLVMRVHERGVGETASCGTGACAAVVAAAQWAGQRAPVAYGVDVPGGHLLVQWTGDTVTLTGSAVIVAEGEVDPARLEAGGEPSSRNGLAAVASAMRPWPG